MIRTFHPGMGQAVAERTILRKSKQGVWENWGDVARRVALGNSLLLKNEVEQKYENKLLYNAIKKASLLMSGRHLQHGDASQPTRTQEIFTNCSTAVTSFLKFYLLLNGSGVGRSVDDDLMVVNWDNAPTIRCVLDEHHEDFDWSAHESVRDAKHKYNGGKDVLWYDIEDTREGWSKALELWERATFEKVHHHKMLILDFTKIRKKGSLIKGMQNRPASGPVPLMNAFKKANTLKGANLPSWLQTMYIDHYFSECVLVGGARRAASIVTKIWTDESAIDFCGVKRPIEFYGKNIFEIKEYLKGISQPPSFLWSSNNSILVDDDFWNRISLKRKDANYNEPLTQHARKLFKVITTFSYGDGTGEPGIINIDKLTQNNDNLSEVYDNYFNSSKYQFDEDTEVMMKKLIRRVKRKKYNMIVNPCGEITLSILGGFCVIGDVVPFFADSIKEAEDCFRIAVRALIRVNTMDSVYVNEVKRTNRIGVGLTGVHEFAWKFFKFGFKDLIDEEKSKEFWMTLAKFNRIVRQESIEYSKKLGLVTPHTCTTIKPSGSVSKLFGLTEGWHLPAMTWYMRWVQFRDDNPLVKEYSKKGYPVRTLRLYPNTVIIGFPTEPIIAGLGMGSKLLTASEATMEEQYKWLQLGEKYWINGVDENGNSIEDKYGNQISYTLKYNPDKVNFNEFKSSLLSGQQSIKSCAVMPQTKAVSYEYQPEEAVSKVDYEKYLRAIEESMVEDIGLEHVDCNNGGCPIDFNDTK